MLKAFKEIDRGVVFSQLLAVLSMVAVFTFFDESAFLKYFHSDSLYLPSIYKDLLQDGGSLVGWHLNHAPGFFPDMFFFLPLTFILGGNWILSSLVFGIIQLVVINRLFILILQRLKLNERAVISLNVLTVFVCLDELYGGFNYFAFFMIWNAFHLGAFVNALLAWWLILRHKHFFLNTALVFGLSIVAVVSDKLFIVYFSAPSIAFVLYSFLVRKERFFPAVLTLSVIIYGVYIGWLKALEWAELGIYNIISADNKVGFIDGIPEAYNMFVFSLAQIMLKPSLTAVVFWIAAFVYVYLTIRVIKNHIKKVEYGTADVLFWVVITCTLFAPIISGAFTGVDAWRYNFPAIIMLAVYLGILISKEMQLSNYTLRLAFGIPATILAVVLVLSANRLITNLNRYPSHVKALDELAVKHNLKYGVAEYWDAKVFTMFSRQDLRVYTAFDVMTPWYHVMNENWFYQQMEEPDKPVDFEFIVYTSPKQKRKADELFGLDYDSVGTDPQVFLTPPFRFNRETYHAYRVID